MNSDSSDYSSSESEVEYEPIVVENGEGKKMLMKKESNALAPIVIVDTKSAAEKTKKSKKSKVFASKDTMLHLIESLNTLQDTKIQQKLDRDASYLQRLTNIEKASRERKSMKTERLNKIKDNLRKGGVRVKGENKKMVREMKEKEEVERGGHRKGSRGGSKSGGSRGGSSSRGGSKAGGSRVGSKSGSNSRGSSSSRGGSANRGPNRASSGGKVQKKVKFSV